MNINYTNFKGSSEVYFALHGSLFGPVNYDYNVTNSINCLLIGSRWCTH